MNDKGVEYESRYNTQNHTNYFIQIQQYSIKLQKNISNIKYKPIYNTSMNDFVAANHERRLKFYYKNYIGIYLSLYKIVSMVLRIVSTLVLNAFVIHVDIFIRFGMMSIAVSCEVSHTILFFNIDGHMYSIPRNIRYMDMLYHCS